MAEVLLFHHALGRTAGVLALADVLRVEGHVVHVPDLFDGRTFATVEAGVAHLEATGFDVLTERGVRTADDLPHGLVYAGLSFGVMAAERLVLERPGARGAVLLHGCVPPEALGGAWPADVPVQVHGMDADPWFAGEGDLDAARALVASVPRGELYTYPGDGHLFAEPGQPGADPAAAAAMTRRILDFVAAL